MTTATRCAVRGAASVNELPTALALASSVVGVNYPSVVAACHLAAFDAASRAGPTAYRPLKELPDRATYDNIRTMVARGQGLLHELGPVTMFGFTFPGGYTAIVDAGDGDFLTADTLWDFKVSTMPPTKNRTLQVLMYYLMGLRSGQAPFGTLTHLGIFNPRLNREWRVAIADIAQPVLDEVACDVIGYRRPALVRPAVVERRSWRTLP